MRFKVGLVVTKKVHVPDAEARGLENKLRTHHAGIIEGVRLGKHFDISLEADDEPHAHKQIGEIAEKLLAQRGTEEYTIVSVHPH